VLPHPPSVKETRHGETDAFAQRIERMLRARPEVRVRDYSSAAYILAQTTRSLTQWLAHEAPSTLDKRSFVDEAVEMVSGYVIAANQS